MLSNLRISHKLLLGFGVILAMLACGSAFTTFSANKIREKSQYVKEIRYKNALEVIGVINLAEGILSDLKSAADSAYVTPLERATANAEELERRILAISGEVDLDAEILDDLKMFDEAFRKIFDAGSAMARYSIEQDFIEFVSAQKEYAGQLGPFKERAEALQNTVSQALSRTLEEIDTLSRQTVDLSLLLSALGLVLGIGLATVISRNISRPMTQVVQMTRELGEGKLYNRLAFSRHDEIGQVAAAMNEMADKLTDLVQQVGRSSGEIQTVSGKISQASKRVEEAAGNQVEEVSRTTEATGQINVSVEKVGKEVDHLSRSAAESISSVLEMTSSIDEVAGNVETLGQSVEQVNAALFQMSGSIHRIAENVDVLKASSDQTASSVAEMDASIIQVEENARETARISLTVREDAEAGKSSVEETIKGIDGILRSAQITAAAVHSLSSKAQDIGQILSVIDDVTSQTNLLALNAAIIASQAGEHGRSFAVVADEIRGLAQRTSLSTREISQMVQDVQGETRKAVEAIAAAEKSIVEGERLSQKSGEALLKIVEGVQKTTLRMEHIASATVEQSKGSRAIREAMERISQMADATAQATREQTQGTESITAAAERMKDLTHQVRSSTREQSLTSKVIARSMEEINELLREIHAATQEQQVEGRHIGSAVEGIQRSAADNLESTRMLRDAVQSLSRQSKILQQEMGLFKVDAGRGLDRSGSA